MKKWLSLILAAVMMFSMCACDSGSSSKSSTSKCTICKKTATHTFQGSGYCTEHYKDAIGWAADNVWNDD